MRRIRFGQVVILVSLLSTLLVTAQAQRAKRAVIVSWDGAADWVVDKLLEEGKLPNVARLAKMGARADYCTPAFPSKTACGHAAIWTGAYSDVNGITGNSVPILPRAEHTLLEQRSGFASEALLAEPIYVTAAKAGKKVVVLSSTQSYPPEPHLAALRAANISTGQFISFSGFESSITGAKVWTATALKPARGWTNMPPHNGEGRELTATVGEQTFHILLYDAPDDPQEGLDTALIRQDSKEEAKASLSCTLKPAEAGDDLKCYSPAFRVTKGELFGNVYFRLFELSPDGKRMTLYQREVNGLRGSATREETEKYLDAYGGFHDTPFFGTYDRGELGKPLWEGGDGAAEKRLLEIVRLDCEFLKRGTRYALTHWKPDLLFHYTPASDSAGHTWMGVLDPDSPRYDKALAEKIWPYYAQVFQLQDDWLGAILDAVDKETVVCLVSDHGMEGVGKTFSPNAVLEKAELAAYNDRRLDLTKTKICAPPWGDYFLSVNGTDWKGGIVTPEEREAVLRAATEALLAATDPETGKPVVTRVFRPNEVVGLGMGGPAGGDLYLDLAPGYVPTSGYIPGIVRSSSVVIGQGVHGFYPNRTKMQAICYIGGAGVKPETRLAGMRQIDIAPTLSRLLGIPAPKDAQGHILGEILAD